MISEERQKSCSWLAVYVSDRNLMPAHSRWNGIRQTLGANLTPGDFTVLELYYWGLPGNGNCFACKAAGTSCTLAEINASLRGSLAANLAITRDSHLGFGSFIENK